MKNIVFIFICAILSLFPHTACTQSFQQPTPEELSMTTDPKAPGADAVYLYREETADDSLHFHSIYVRMKILTEKGKEEASVKIPYLKGESKVAGLKGRTIHADGTVIPMTVKPSDLMEFKQGENQLNNIVFTLPSVEVGSIIEYKLDIQYSDDSVYSPKWHIQQPYFVHKAHYRFVPDHSGGHYILNERGEALSQLLYTSMLPHDTAVKADVEHNYTLDLTDIAPTADEEWSPPLDAFNWHVYFYYSYAKSEDEYWQTEGSLWRKSVERFIKPDKNLREIASSLVTSSDTEEQKAQKLYTAVMKLENTDYTRHKSEAELKAARQKEARSAEDVWKQKSGTSDELAMLYVALVNAAGMRAWPMLVSDRSRNIFDPSFLSLSQLDAFIAVVSVNGKDLYLDPGEKFCDFGELSWKHLYSGGLRITADYKGATLSGTPQANHYDKAAVQRLADITLDVNGGIKGYARYIMIGPEALKWRQLNLTDGSDEVKKQFNEMLGKELPDGVHGEFDRFVGLDDPSAKLVASVNLSGTMGTATGKRYFLPGLFFESHATHPFVSVAKRLSPVDMQYASMTQDSVNFHLPAGFTVESTPNSSDVTWPNNAILRIKSTVDGNELNVSRLLARNFILVKSSDYQQLHDLFTKVATADQQQIVLVRTAPLIPKGN